MSSKALIVAGLVLAIVVGAVGVLYAFGTPTGPAPETAAAESSAVAAEAEPEAAAAPSQGEPSGEQKITPPDPSSPLAIEIPGCVCHSDDPKIVKEHSGYRMNQCAGCHAGQVPTGTAVNASAWPDCHGGQGRLLPIERRGPGPTAPARTRCSMMRV